MSHSFKIKLLKTARSRCRAFDSKEAALEYAGKLAEESETAPARLVIERGDRSPVITLSCSLHAAIGYLRDFSIPLENMIPEPPRRRRRSSRSSVRY